MNVFVLSTGRCGTTTFAAACRHIRNYSAAHESHIGLVGPRRTVYPERHIEIDNRLSWFLGRLDRSYGRRAFYVHLVRDTEATARSHSLRLWSGSLISAYINGIYMNLPQAVDPLATSKDLVETINANIEQFLADKPNKMLFDLARADTDFGLFWRSIGAEGDLDAALAEWRTRHNATPEPNAAIGKTPRSSGRERRATQLVRRLRRHFRSS